LLALLIVIANGGAIMGGRVNGATTNLFVWAAVAVMSAAAAAPVLAWVLSCPSRRQGSDRPSSPRKARNRAR